MEQSRLHLPRWTVSTVVILVIILCCSMLAGVLLLTLLALVSGQSERQARDTLTWAQVQLHLQSEQAQQQARQQLAALVEQQSVRTNCSGLTATKNLIVKELKRLGAHSVRSVVSTPTPCAHSIAAEIGRDPEKKTVLMYAHFDVVPANARTWRQADPFRMTISKDSLGRRYFNGRGVSDDKGQVVAWFQAIDAWQQIQGDLPVNLKIILDAEEESGSPGLNAGLAGAVPWLRKFVSDAHCVIFTDGVGLNDDEPSLMLGLRGINYFNLRITGPAKNFHSGTHGGVLYEPMTDMVRLLAALQAPPRAGPATDQVTKLIQVPSFYRSVASDQDINYSELDFDVDAFKQEVGVDRLLYEDKTALLRHLWSLPSLTIHRIKSTNVATSIAGEVIADLSFRLAPGQSRQHTRMAVERYLNEMHRNSGSPNKLLIREMGADPWIGHTDTAYFKVRFMEYYVYISN